MVPNCVPRTTEEVQSEEMSPQEVSLQKKKAMLDKMIAPRECKNWKDSRQGKV